MQHAWIFNARSSKNILQTEQKHVSEMFDFILTPFISTYYFIRTERVYSKRTPEVFDALRLVVHRCLARVDGLEKEPSGGSKNIARRLVRGLSTRTLMHRT